MNKRTIYFEGREVRINDFVLSFKWEINFLLMCLHQVKRYLYNICYKTEAHPHLVPDKDFMVDLKPFKGVNK